MSVLENMRSGSDSTFMQVVFALVVVSFVFWYAVPNGDTSRTVATVNGTRIMDTQFNRAYRGALAQAEQRYNRVLSNEERDQIGEQVRQQLIEDEVVLQEAKRLGIEVSDSEIARSIAEQPYFKNEEGVFDLDILERQLKRMQMTRPDYEDQMRKDMTREKLRLLVYTGASVSDPEIRKSWTEANTKVDIKYVKVRGRDFQNEVQIAPEQVDQYITENEPEIKARYDRDYQRMYNLPNRVVLRVIKLPVTPDQGVADVLPQMNTLREQIEAGADFAEVAKANSSDPSAVDGGLLDARPVGTLGAEEIAALEGVDAGQMTRAFTTASDVRLYKVEERLDAEVIDLEAVKKDIAEAMIREEGAPVLAATFAEEQLLAKWKESGEVPQDLVDEKGLLALTTGEIPVQAQSGNPFAPPPELLAAARTIEPGAVFAEVYESAGTMWVAQLVSRSDPDPMAFDAQKEDMAEQVLAQKRSEFFTGWVAAAKSKASIQ